MSQISDNSVNFAGTDRDGNCALVTNGGVSQVLRGQMGTEDLFRGDGWGWIQFVQ